MAQPGSVEAKFEEFKKDPSKVTEQMGMDLALSVRDVNISLYTTILLWTFNERKYYRQPVPEPRPIKLRRGAMTIRIRDLPDGIGDRDDRGAPLRDDQFFVLMPKRRQYASSIIEGILYRAEIYYKMQYTDMDGKWVDPKEFENAKAWRRQGVLVDGPLYDNRGKRRKIRWTMKFGGTWKYKRGTKIPTAEHE